MRSLPLWPMRPNPGIPERGPVRRFTGPPSDPNPFPPIRLWSRRRAT